MNEIKFYNPDGTELPLKAEPKPLEYTGKIVVGHFDACTWSNLEMAAQKAGGVIANAVQVIGKSSEGLRQMYDPNDTTTSGFDLSLSELLAASNEMSQALAMIDEAYEPKAVCLGIVLPPRKGLVFKQQESKIKQQMKVWGLRK